LDAVLLFVAWAGIMPSNCLGMNALPPNFAMSWKAGFWVLVRAAARDNAYPVLWTALNG